MRRSLAKGQRLGPLGQETRNSKPIQFQHLHTSLIPRHRFQISLWSFNGFSGSLRGPCRAVGGGHDADTLSPEELMRKLAADHGVRIYSGGPNSGTRSDGDWDADAVDEDDEDEDWDEVVSELGNPWDMRPGRVGLLEDDEAIPAPGGDGRSSQAAAAASAPGGTAPGPRPSSGAGPLYGDPAAVPRIGRQELLQLIRGAGNAPGRPSGTGVVQDSDYGGGDYASSAGSSGNSSGSSDSGSETASVDLDGEEDPGAESADGKAGGTAKRAVEAAEEAIKAEAEVEVEAEGSRPRVVLVDVRELAEVEAEAEEGAEEGVAEEGAAVDSSAGAGASAGGDLRRPARAQGLPAATLLVPLASMRRPQAAQLQSAADYVVVLCTGDHRGEQAVIRLTKVYGLRRVLLYDESIP